MVTVIPSVGCWTIDQIRLGAPHKDISDRQYAWFGDVLAKHPDVRWTFVFMHQPSVWRTSRWQAFEKAHLVSRKHTVFAGDWHTYLHVRWHGHDYYVLATAGIRAGKKRLKRNTPIYGIIRTCARG